MRDRMSRYEVKIFGELCWSFPLAYTKPLFTWKKSEKQNIRCELFIVIHVIPTQSNIVWEKCWRATRLYSKVKNTLPTVSGDADLAVVPFPRKL